MSLLWGFAIADALIAVALYFVNANFMLSLCILAGIIVAEIEARCTFSLFFSCKEDFFEAWHFHFKPDLRSWIDGELWDDWKAEWKLSCYHLLIIIAGFGTFALLALFLCGK